MKTKDLIKMLQEADPSGEAFVRLGEGPIRFVELKEGYWDGPYSYMDERNGKESFICSDKGMKVDVYTYDMHSFIWELVDLGYSLEEVQERFTFELSDNHRKDAREVSDRVEIERIFKEAKSFCEQLHAKNLEEVLEKYSKGFRLYRKLNVEKTEPWMYVLTEEGDFQKGISEGHLRAVLRSREIFKYQEYSDREGFGVYLIA